MGWSWPWVLSASSYFYINTLKLFIFLFFYSVLKRGQKGVSLFQSLVSLYSEVFHLPVCARRRKRGGALLAQELSFCTVIVSWSQDSNRAESRGLWIPLNPWN